MAKILDNIRKLAEKEGITIGAIERKIGASKGVLSRAMTNGTDIQAKWITAIVENYPYVSADWLLTGKGEMLNSSESSQKKMVKVSEQSEEGIPLIPLDAMAGYFEGEMQVLLRDCERYIVPGMPRADFLITVKGDSMMPSYFPGDIVACVRVPIKDVFFQFGRVYVLDTNQGAIIKRIEKSEDDESILIVSENEKYSPFTLHLSQVRSIALVIGLIRLE